MPDTATPGPTAQQHEASRNLLGRNLPPSITTREEAEDFLSSILDMRNRAADRADLTARSIAEEAAETAVAARPASARPGPTWHNTWRAYSFWMSGVSSITSWVRDGVGAAFRKDPASFLAGVFNITSLLTPTAFSYLRHGSNGSTAKWLSQNFMFIALAAALLLGTLYKPPSSSPRPRATSAASTARALAAIQTETRAGEAALTAVGVPAEESRVIAAQQQFTRSADAVLPEVVSSAEAESRTSREGWVVASAGPPHYVPLSQLDQVRHFQAIAAARVSPAETVSASAALHGAVVVERYDSRRNADEVVIR